MPYLLLTCAALFWSGNFVLSRGMHAEIPPLALSFWRWSVALAILSLFAVGKLWLQRREARRQARFIIIQGLLGGDRFQHPHLSGRPVYHGNQRGAGQLLASRYDSRCAPGFFYRDALTIRQGCGVLTSLVGVWLIIGRGSLATLLELTMNRGDLLVLLAAVLWACYSANLKRYPKELHPYAYQAGIVIVGLAGLTPFYLLERVSGTGFALTPATIAYRLFMWGCFASVLAFFSSGTMRCARWPQQGGTVHSSDAGIFPPFLAVIFLGEAPVSLSPPGHRLDRHRHHPHHLPDTTRQKPEKPSKTLWQANDSIRQNLKSSTTQSG